MYMIWGKYRNPQKILLLILPSVVLTVCLCHRLVLLCCIIMLLHLAKSSHLPCKWPYCNWEISLNSAIFFSTSPQDTPEGIIHSHITIFHILTSVSYYEEEVGWTSPTIYLISHINSVINSLTGRSWQESPVSSVNILQGKHFAVERASSWETHLKAPLSWSHLMEQTVPGLRGPKAPRVREQVSSIVAHPLSLEISGHRPQQARIYFLCSFYLSKTG